MKQLSVIWLLLLLSCSGFAANLPLADAAEKSDRATIRTLPKLHAAVNALARDLDALVYALDNLTPDEVKLVVEPVQ